MIELHDQHYRLNNIYRIRDKAGQIITYKPNPVQMAIYNGLHNRNVIPKARQHGITTAICLYFLDQCLWQSNQRAAIIAHRETDALKIFETKIKFPYQQLDPAVKYMLADSVKVTSNTVEFDNGSIISADTMVRSDTLNYLHVSELGKMSAWYPIKAEEVKTGAFPAAEKGIICVESTMEGNIGLMADLCTAARTQQELGTALTSKDFKFFFFPWYMSDDYQLAESVMLTQDEEQYFDDLKNLYGIILSDQQKAWYAKEHAILGERMWQEYPSTFDETIQSSLEGAFFARQLAQARQEQRICHMPYDSHLRVYAAMDIGINDATAIWLFQVLRNEVHFIDYYEMSGEDLGHYMSWLTGRPYQIDIVFLPHDAGARSQHTARTYEEIVRTDFGYKTRLLERDSHELIGIEDAKNTFSLCFFDQSKCARGLECLALFKKEFNRRFGIYTRKSVHDEYSDGAKAFIYALKGVAILKRSSSGPTVEEIRRIRESHRRII